ncbi:MAG: DNA polymerase III subunit delta' [Campylobacter sp.]
MNNQIILTNDYERVKFELIDEFGANNLRFIERDEILLDDAKEAVREAYIAEKQLKIIVLKGDKFGIEAQNSLLLILEESPKNIAFILVAPAKNIFLPTICSRMFIKTKFNKIAPMQTNLNFTRLTLMEIMQFLDEKIAAERIGEFGKTELKSTISVIFRQSLAQGVKFSEKELELIKKLAVLADLNAKAHSVLTPLLLMIERKNR